MKNLIIYICFLGLSSSISAQSLSKNIESKIEKVTVFLTGAQIERSGKTSIPKGKSEIVFKGISPSIDKNSIQLKGEGKFTVLNVSFQKNFTEEQQKRTEIKDFESKLEENYDQSEMNRALLDVYLQEESLLKQNQKIGGNATLKAIEIKEAADFQRERLTEIKSKLLDIAKKMKADAAESEKIRNQLVELKAKKDLSTGEIHVNVNATEAVSGTFYLKYLVSEAGWYANYDIRVTDVSKPLTIVYKAKVFQNSGEDWKDVKLSFSSANPNESGNGPVLKPWKLRFVTMNNGGLTYSWNGTYNVTVTDANGCSGKSSGKIVDRNGNPVPFATIVVTGTSVGTVSDGDGNFSLSLPADAKTLTISSVGYDKTIVSASMTDGKIVLQDQTLKMNDILVAEDKKRMVTRGARADLGLLTIDGTKVRGQESIVTETNQRQTSVSFDITDPYSIPSDGKVYSVDINEHELNAQYEYYAVPKIDKDAFLNAMIVGWEDLNLLEGEANLFFEETFLGTSILDIRNAKDTLSISLGRDKNIVINRTKLKEFSKRQIAGSNQVEYRNWEISIKNNKKQKINLTIFDQIPISTQKEIEVSGVEHPEGILDEETGKITWKMSLDATQNKKIGFKYSVKYPKNQNLNLE